MKKPALRRRRLLIHPEIQLKILLTGIGFALATSASVYVVAQLSLARLGQRLLATGIPLGHPLQLALQEFSESIAAAFAIAGGFSVIAIASFGLAFTNRIAGPIYRLKKHLRDINQGRTMDNVHFRKNDYFMDLEAEFNEHLARQRGEIQKPKKVA